VRTTRRYVVEQGEQPLLVEEAQGITVTEHDVAGDRQLAHD
jgi:hypothetical protein